jgi:hypothetical protein
MGGETSLPCESLTVMGTASGGDAVELLYDLFFKDAVMEAGVLRKRLDELATTPAMHVVKYAINTNGDGHVLLPVKTERGWKWEPTIALKAA